MTTAEPKAAEQPQSAAAPSRFTPIADYAFLSNCHTGALVAPDGSIDWLCVPSFDGPSVFGSLLDRGAGFARFAPFGINHPTARTYEPGTNVLRVTWKTPTGWVVITDALTLGSWEGEDTHYPAHTGAGERRRRPHGRADGRVHRRPRELQSSWQETAEAIRSDVLSRGVDGRGVLRQHYDAHALDASILLAAIFGFLPGDDERLRATVEAIDDELTDHGFVLRYRTGETDDGLSGEEGTFLISSFWLVSVLAIVGEIQRARDLMERLLRIASPLGLYAEEFDADTGRHLGNFPQAFSHLALIEAAARIIVAERLEEM